MQLVRSTSLCLCLAHVEWGTPVSGTEIYWCTKQTDSLQSWSSVLAVSHRHIDFCGRFEDAKQWQTGQVGLGWLHWEGKSLRRQGSW